MIRRNVLKLAAARARIAPLAPLAPCPGRPIRFLVPCAPGGGADIACRRIALVHSEIQLRAKGIKSARITIN